MTECDPARRRDPASAHAPELCLAESSTTTARRGTSQAPVDTIRTSPDVDAYYKSLRATPMGKALSDVEKLAATQKRIDGVRDAFSGPYTVNGQRLTAPPMFRINAGNNTTQMKAHAKELAQIVGNKVPNLYAVQMGCCKPADLVKVTQLLIDAGKLPSGPAATFGDRVKQMQWEWGVGIDCAAYTRATLTAATGKTGSELGLAPMGTENFVSVGQNPRFKKVGITDVQVGDLITLRAPGDYGHNVIVHGHFLVNDAKKAELGRRMGSDAVTFLGKTGPFHAIEVDSSWSAGTDGDTVGGYRRDTWLYDESTKQWGYLNQHVTPAAFVKSDVGPAGDHFHGAFRAR